MSLLPPIDPKIKTTFWKCSLIGWGSPAALLAIAIFLQSTGTNKLQDVSELQIENCWFLTGYAYIIAYTIPMILIFIMTTVYLAKTFIAIKQTVGVQVCQKILGIKTTIFRPDLEIFSEFEPKFPDRHKFSHDTTISFPGEQKSKR